MRKSDEGKHLKDGLMALDVPGSRSARRSRSGPGPRSAKSRFAAG